MIRSPNARPLGVWIMFIVYATCAAFAVWSGMQRSDWGPDADPAMWPTIWDFGLAPYVYSAMGGLIVSTTLVFCRVRAARAFVILCLLGIEACLAVYESKMRSVFITFGTYKLWLQGSVIMLTVFALLAIVTSWYLFGPRTRTFFRLA